MQHFSGLSADSSGFVPWGLSAAPAFTPWSADALPQAADEELRSPENPATEQLRADAYDAGFAAGRATIEAELVPERAALHRLAEGLQALKPEPTGPLALLLVETVDRLVRQVVGEVAIDPNLLLARARAAAQLVADEARPSSIHLNPADHARLAGADLPLPLVIDPSVAPGSVLLESAEGWVEDGVAARLDAVRAALMRIE